MIFKSITKKNQPGFTLMELGLYIAILSVMTIAVANIFLSLNKGIANVEAKSELNSNFRFTIEKMKRDISSATAISNPAIAGATSTTLSLTVDGQTIAYTVTGNRVSRQVDSSPVEYISSDLVNVTALSFTRLENTNAVFNKKRISVEINISAQYNSSSPDLRYLQSQKTTVDLNKDF